MDNSFSTLLVPTPRLEMEYKYVVINNFPAHHIVKVIDLSGPQCSLIELSSLLERGWRPVRESRFGGGGDTAAMSILVLLEREKPNDNQ